MQVVKKFLLSLFVLWFAILFFMPKQEMYYKIEEELAKNDIKINEKSIEEGLFSLTLHTSKVYVKGIQLATVEKIDFFTLLFYTKVEVKNLLLDESLKHAVPTNIDDVEVVHALWNPIQLSVYAQGSFGTVHGNATLMDRSLRLDFNETKEIDMLKANLKQDEKGWFYETAF